MAVSRGAPGSRATGYGSTVKGSRPRSATAPIRYLPPQRNLPMPKPDSPVRGGGNPLAKIKAAPHGPVRKSPSVTAPLINPGAGRRMADARRQGILISKNYSPRMAPPSGPSPRPGVPGTPLLGKGGTVKARGSSKGGSRKR